MLVSEEDWVWDCWVGDDGRLFHLYFLCAPRSLAPHERHFHARVGHAISADLSSWTRLTDAVRPGASGYDSRAIWTGSVLRDRDGWRMFRTGLSFDDAGWVQRIGCDLSEDLHRWRPEVTEGWPLRADGRWYELSASDEHWRDPWVVADPSQPGLFHMYITARSADTGPGAGVIGHAVSSDLSTWEVQPPLTDPGCFEQLEVIQVVCVEGRWVLLFSCLGTEMSPPDPGAGGIWSVPIDAPGARVDLGRASRLTDESLYAGRLVLDRTGTWQLLAFVNVDEQGEFGGWIADPIAVHWNEEGALAVSKSSQGAATGQPLRR